MEGLLRGRDSVRLRGERTRLALTLAFLPVTLGVLGYLLHQAISPHDLLLILIGAMLFVALSRGRFLGGGVRLGPTQFPHVSAIAEECAALIGIATPQLFVRDDPFVPLVAIGTAEPYALVFSAQYLEAFGEDEMRFLIGRELAHVAAGHTKLSSLLSANGRENAIVSLAFGAWLRWTEYTADRVGLLCCGSLHAAISGIAVSSFGHLGRKVDLHSFAEQRRELDAEPMLRFGEWLGGAPYATNRIAKLGVFARDPRFARWSERLERRRARPADGPAAASGERFAGPWPRLAACAIDLFLVSRLTSSVTPPQVAPQARAVLASSDVPAALRAFMLWLGGGSGFAFGFLDALTVVAFAVYVVVLVAVTGQTLGMMICNLRVIGVRRERIGLGGALARYACFVLSVPLVVGIFSLFRRIQPFERWSRTRLVNGTVARA